MTTPRAATPDAAVSERNDAPASDTPASPLPISTECVRGPGHPCNPPRPAAPPEQPRVLDGDVIQHDVRADGLVFTAKTEHEVSSESTGVFIDDKGPLANTEFTIKVVRGYQVVCMLAGRRELPSKRVRFYEPGAKR